MAVMPKIEVIVTTSTDVRTAMREEAAQLLQRGVAYYGTVVIALTLGMYLGWWWGK